MCTFISIFQMFTFSYIFPCWGKQYVHFYSNISYVCCLTHVHVSGSKIFALCTLYMYIDQIIVSKGRSPHWIP